MAVANSYSRVQGPGVGFYPGAQESSSRVQGPAIALFGGGASSYQRPRAFADVDDSDTVVPRVENGVQRPSTNTVDVSGKIYNTNGGAVALVAVEYSQVSNAGPWLPVTVLTGDGAYVFPSPGIPAGSAFNIPVEITDNFTGNVWFKIEISSPLPNTSDVGGPFSFVFVNPFPGAPASLTVPLTSITGTYFAEWVSDPKATFYNLEEATQPDFSDAVQIYSGPDLQFLVENRTEGTRYYRVQGENSYGTGPFTEAANSVQVIPPSAPPTMILPAQSKTGTYTISWGAVAGATGYELQEDIDPSFVNNKTIYSGPDTMFTVKNRQSGAYYYRVRARRV